MTPAKLLAILATDPRRARSLAHGLTRAVDPALQVTALRVLALATRELGPAPRTPALAGPPPGGALAAATLADAERWLRTALETAERAGLGYEAAQVRGSLAALLTEQGLTREALAAADAATGTLHGGDAARVRANRICALARGGRLAEARELALGVRDDPDAPPGLLMNAGLALATCGEIEAAELCLTEAAVRADRANLRHEAAMARANLAYVTGRRGDLPGALRLYTVAERGLTGIRAAQVRMDRAEVLIVAGLPGEARPLIASALDDLGRSGCSGDVADGLLLLARAELTDEDPEQAVETAEAARTAYAAQDRAGWALTAEHLLLQARWAAGDRSGVFYRSAVAIADRLAAGGWTWEAADARLIAARLALHLGRPATALLDAAATARHQGPAALRAAAWHAVALGRLAAGDRRGAFAAVRAGLRVVGDHAAALGALELRVHATRLCTDLADLGAELAATPAALLGLEEARRAVCWHPSAPAPAARPDRLLAELRHVASALETATAGGEDTGALAARQLRLESDLRAQTLMSSGPSPAADRNAGRGDLRTALVERALVEYLRVGDELQAVTVVNGRYRRWALGSYAEAAHDATLLRFALRRRAWGPAAGDGWKEIAGRLAERLLGEVSGVVRDRELVVAPVGGLHGVAWAALPGSAGRALSVVPSTAAWSRARRAPVGGRVVLVAGPGLAHAEAEVGALARIHPEAVVRQGAEATVDVVRAELDGADLVHLAAHGVFRGVLSGLGLHDGRLLVQDLAGVRAPRVVVLAACEGGRADDGEGALGLAGAFLAAGASCVIASVVPVGDAATAGFMAGLHRGLATGSSPARALAALPRTPEVLGFQCFGAG